MDNNNSETLSDIRVMLLGDSITQANTEHVSYRRPLWQKLNEAGFNNVDFVGSSQENQGGSNPNPDFDLDHEGHWGWFADEVLERIGDWAVRATPDIVLMHLGTNDIGSGQDIAETTNEIREIVQRLRVHNPRVHVLLAMLRPHLT